VDQRIINRISADIEEKKDEVVQFALELVKKTSENPPGDETGVARLIKDKASKWGLPEPEIWAKEPHRPNLIFRITGARKGRALILNAHTDTKPIGDASKWTVDPFAPAVIDGKLYGRGSTDMKGAACGILAAGMALVKNKLPLKGDVILALTADEEAGSTYGAEYLVEKGLRADALLIAEPSGIDEDFDSLGLACRGVTLGKVVVRGTQMHSSLSDRGGCVNASVKMAEVLVEFANNLKKNLRHKPHPLYPEGPTVNPGVILEGCVFYGVIPGEASFGFDIRVIPGMTCEGVKRDMEKFLEKLRKKDKDLQAELVFEDPPLDWLAPVEIEKDHPLVLSCMEASKKVLGREPKLLGVPFGTDAVFYSRPGIDMPIIPSFGPGLIKLAHGPDEYIEARSILDSARIFALTAIEFLE
jgi:acetylornithine deacetylase/succinyl-diaminopimelate desuccinylase family protein